MVDKKVKTGILLMGIVVAMSGFGFALVPLYSTLCRVTGLNGKFSNLGEAAPYNTQVDFTREVEVALVATANPKAPLIFYPKVPSVRLHPGELVHVEYEAENTTAREIWGQAIPSISPGLAAQHLHKLECFCFSQQRFAPREKRALPVVFTVSKDLPKDVPSMALSYTFFQIQPNENATGG